MITLGVIEPSISPYCSLVVLVDKADRKWCSCVDFRVLTDESVVDDAESIPRMDEALSNFVGDVYFANLDFCRGYWQIPLMEKAKPYTASATHKYGIMQFTKLPSGVCWFCLIYV